MTQIESGHCPDDRPDESAMRCVERVERLDGSVILYDGSLTGQIDGVWFERDSWPDAERTPGFGGGRGATLFIRCLGQDWVLRHYHRGGAIAQFVDDRFIWVGEKRTRAFAEWRLLARIQAAGLPAPRPVAARYRRQGVTYSADLITVRLPGVMPLSTRLARGVLAAATWEAVGRCIGRFHRAGFFHADLNAHNVQINAAEEIFLLDFDRGRTMPGPGAWQRRNLRRLHRSLRKISADAAVRFDDRNWQALLDGYRGVAGTSAC
ncbi:MAG: 3-deoxy-D-manno-octulosonic acid kinase [Gammaproteobacteria bacterium]|nr:3-deoxy-D-manno-octulosonic acid kinase [Gammaproteobacteria bacterium]